jgi:hypothetical protein
MTRQPGIRFTAGRVASATPVWHRSFAVTIPEAGEATSMMRWYGRIGCRGGI